ncbi:MAG TPA: pyridine nucleotide-disulfide oxidoreductase [Gammaproteobacteria bacterium]|nr:pyridine nucleotide-disulfide oxidoreductase [Gammaproteobacteria bacterium]
MSLSTAILAPEADEPSTTLDTLGIPGFRYADLHQPERLAALSTAFDAALEAAAPALAGEYRQWLDGTVTLAVEEESDLVVRLAPHVGGFVARLFGVEAERAAKQRRILVEFDTIFRFRSEVVQKAGQQLKGDLPSPAELPALTAALDTLRSSAFPSAGADADPELATASLGLRLGHLALHAAEHGDELARLRQRLQATGCPQLATSLDLADDAAFAQSLFSIVQRWCVAVLRVPGFAPQAAQWVSFKEPAKRDFNDLVAHETVQVDGYTAWMGPHAHRRRRDGFGLTDPRMQLREVLYEVDHCIYCHDRDTDSCAKGMRNRKTGGFKTNPLGMEVIGCPLGERISEMHWVKRGGDDIGALAIVMIDNPMCPGTGHRICNDCMKGCIYQKTEPVNIPQIETNVLTEVLNLPWGFEIYGLLSRWNPLNRQRRHALPYNGKKVLVVGMGPAGYTLSHYLLNEGFAVVGIDGLKIEPLPADLIGSGRDAPLPVREYSSLVERLDQRILAGFGGVAEYGITVRWDKNFLKVIYATLARRHSFRVYGGVRFGGTLTVEDAWALGFDHIALAVGAGQPTLIGLKNNLVRGVRKASDFLMALQLTGAAKADSLANLQVRLPAGVIGGGLTAIDTATETLAYYPIQVEKALHRYETLVARLGESRVRARFDAEELGVLDEFLAHGRAICAERKRAEAAGEPPDFVPLLEAWGGVTLFYRKGMQESPAYRANHEEIDEALEEGIRLAEGMDPKEAITDEHGALAAVRFARLARNAEGRWEPVGEIDVRLRSLFVAAGTSPNTTYEQEQPGTFRMDRKYFQRHLAEWVGEDLELIEVPEPAGLKQGRVAPLTSYRHQGRFISFYGDNHPVYAGNVVKAMASAKDSYPHVVALFERELAALPRDREAQAARDAALTGFQQELDGALLASIVEVRRLTPTIVEVIVRAPMAARRFQPGQFYRVQNLETCAPRVGGTVLAAEGLALTGAWVDREAGIASFITLEMGGSSRLCALWQPGDPVVVMGVTGTPTEIPVGRTVMLVGGGLGNAVQFSIGRALRAAGSRVIYFAGYKKVSDLFRREDIEAAADVVVWAVDPGAGVEAIEPHRPQDYSHVGNILDTIEAYAEGRLGEPSIPLSEVDHMIVIGSDRMMAAVKEARHGRLAPWLKRGHRAIGSINSPMQCMMKGVCAQCLCRHVDPETGAESFVYSCFDQDQDLDRVDFRHLAARLRQNSLAEKLSDLWLDHLLQAGADLLPKAV